MNRAVQGFLIAPLASGLLQGLIMGNLGAMVFALLFSYSFAIILGLPAYVYFKKNGWLLLWQVVLAGAFLGTMCGLIVNIGTSFENYSLMSVVLGLGLFGLHGLVVSSAFWFLAIRDVSSNKSPQPTANGGG